MLILNGEILALKNSYIVACIKYENHPMHKAKNYFIYLKYRKNNFK